MNALDSPFILALLPLAGVVVGTLLGYFLNKANEQRKSDEAKAQRWDQNVLDHTSRIVLLTIRLIQYAEEHEVAVERIAKEIARGMKPGDPVTQTGISQETLDTLMGTYESLAIELIAMRLVSTTSVRATLNGIQESSSVMLNAPDLDSIREKAVGLRKASGALEAAVREHFGIS